MQVICPRCMTEASVTLDLDDGDTLRCPECSEEYTVGDVADLVDCWAKLLPWLRAHPARTAPPQPVCEKPAA